MLYGMSTTALGRRKPLVLALGWNWIVLPMCFTALLVQLSIQTWIKNTHHHILLFSSRKDENFHQEMFGGGEMPLPNPTPTNRTGDDEGWWFVMARTTVLYCKVQHCLQLSKKLPSLYPFFKHKRIEGKYYDDQLSVRPFIFWSCGTLSVPNPFSSVSGESENIL